MTREGAIDRRDVTPGHAFGDEPGGGERQLGPGACQVRCVPRNVDLVAEEDRLLGAQTQQVGPLADVGDGCCEARRDQAAGAERAVGRGTRLTALGW